MMFLFRKCKKLNTFVILVYSPKASSNKNGGREYMFTLSARFLSLFMTVNCFNLALTVSPSDTLGAVFAFCNHG